MKKALIPLAPGFEEVEALTVVDILRRAGADVTLAGTISNAITGRNGIKVLADEPLEAVTGKTFDMVVIPGGAQGTENLKRDVNVKKAVERIVASNGFITAICAGPTVLAGIGAIKGRQLTCHPSAREELCAEKLIDERVVIDGKLITSQSPGSAMEFAFALVEALFGKAKVKEVNKGVMALL
ncbi:MAG: DJ-1/PfpI family protein [Deltaproteobacteria bacterium]|nr:DJ-1/PfpI family protein [Deltaproteobacteria bacterium]